MSDPDAIAECEADIYSMGALQEKTTDAGDGLVMMTEEETYHSDSVQGSDIGQEEPPVEVDEPLELRNSQEIAVNDKQCPPAVSGDGGDSRQKTPGDTAVGEQDLAVASRQHTPSRERRVYVGNLSYQVTWRDLKDFMRKCGSVVYADVLTEYNGMSKGCGVVEYSTKEEAQCAIRELDDTQLLGRSIFVREDREEGSESGAPHFRRGRYGHRAGAGGAQAYGHNGRRGYAYRGSASSDHGYNTRGYGGFNDAYDNFYGRIYNYDRPYSRGDGSSRYGAFDNYRDFGFRRRSGGFNPRDNTYRSNYSRQGFGGRNGMQHGRSYYYGHRNYGGNRGPQPFSGINRNDAPTSVYCRNYGGPYTGGDGLNAGYVGGAYINRDTSGMMQSYTDRSSYSTDYNGQGGTDRHTGGEYTRNTGYTMGGDTVDFENTRSSYDNVKYRGENRDNLYRN